MLNLPHNVGLSVRLNLPHNVGLSVRLTLPHNAGLSVSLTLPHNAAKFIFPCAKFLGNLFLTMLD